MRKDDDDTAHLLDGRKKNVILLFTDGYSPVIFTVQHAQLPLYDVYFS